MQMQRVTLIACFIIVCVLVGGCVKSKYNTRSFMSEEELAEIQQQASEARVGLWSAPRPEAPWKHQAREIRKLYWQYNTETIDTVVPK